MEGVEDGKSFMVTKALIATNGVTAIRETNLKPYEFATSTEGMLRGALHAPGLTPTPKLYNSPARLPQTSD